MRRPALVLALLLCASPALAATNYYFSNCAGPGGDGTIGNPWCLIPTGQVTKISFALLSDGINIGAANPEFAPGDTAFLCAGACDGAGSATYSVQGTTTNKCFGGSNSGAACALNSDCNSGECASGLLVPRMTGSIGNPITVQVYCTGGTCEKVSLSGDSNGNGAFDAGEIGTFVQDSLSPLSYWTFDGDPLNTGACNDPNVHSCGLAFTNFNGVGIDISNGGTRNFTQHGVETRGAEPATWTGASQGPLQATCGANGHYAIHISSQGAGPISLTHNWYHDLCAYARRVNRQTSVNTNASVDDSYNWFDNVGAVAINNAFSLAAGYTGSASGLTGSYYQFSHNLATDSGVVKFKDDFQHVVLTDNVIACPGNHAGIPTDGCGGISFVFGDTPNCTLTCVGGSTPGVDCATGFQSGNNGCAGGGTCTGPSDCAMDDILIARNRVYGTATGASGAGSVVLGQMSSGLIITGIYNHGGATSWPLGFVVENNMIYGVHPRFTFVECGTSNAPGRAGINTDTATSGLVLRNNTVYGSDFPIYICGTGSGSLRDNAIYRAERSAGHVGPELIVVASAAGWTLDHNDINTGGLGGNPVATGCSNTMTGCTNVACGSVAGSVGTNNVCAAATFLCSGTDAGGPGWGGGSCTTSNPATWNLHLNPGAQPVINGGASCSSTDFDLDARTAVCDIGADEVGTSASTKRRIVVVTSE